MQHTLYLSADTRRQISECNHNYSREGIYHPDRVMDEYDFLYLQNGAWDITEDDTCFHLLPNQVLILEPHRHHYSLEKSSPEMKNMYVHCSVLPQDGIPAPDALRVNKQTDCTGNRFVSHYFERIIETQWTDFIPNKGFRLGALFDMLLSELAALCSAQVQTPDMLVTEIIHHFHGNTDRFFSPEELANDYGVSLRTISGRFKKATGQSIHQYQLQLKLNMAYDLLPVNPGRGLRDIALSLGFYDEFQFSRLFKRQFGISPSARRT